MYYGAYTVYIPIWYYNFVLKKANKKRKEKLNFIKSLLNPSKSPAFIYLLFITK